MRVTLSFMLIVRQLRPHRRLSTAGAPVGRSGREGPVGGRAAADHGSPDSRHSSPPSRQRVSAS